MNACDINLEKKRCDWAENQSKLYIKYHDEEWGVPVYDDRVLFEFLILEGAQAGLSWSTILNRRTGYRKLLQNLIHKKLHNLMSEKFKNYYNVMV